MAITIAATHPTTIPAMAPPESPEPELFAFVVSLSLDEELDEPDVAVAPGAAAVVVAAVNSSVVTLKQGT